MRFAAAALCVVALAATVATTHALGFGANGAWNQIHHDAHNSGRANFTTNLATGKCTVWTAYPNKTYGQEVIEANGVMGVKGDYVFFVGNAQDAYLVHQVHTETGEQADEQSQDFKDYTTPNAVGSVAVGIIPIIPPVPPAAEEGSGEEALTDESSDPAPAIQGENQAFYAFGHDVYAWNPSWTWTAPEPIYAPIRLSPLGGTLFVASTNATHDGNGTLHAIDTLTGKEIWNFKAMQFNEWFGMRITPAVTEDGLVIVCYGQTMAILNAFNGSLVHSVNTYPLGPILGSSPVINSAVDAFWLQSLSDDVWRVKITAKTVDANATLVIDWVCSYETLEPQCLNWTTVNNAVSLQNADLPEHFRKVMEQPRRNAGDPLPPSLQPRIDPVQGVPFDTIGDVNRATPALGPDDATIIFPRYSTTADEGGVHCADARTGARVWRYLSSQDSPYLGDMMGRSSAAVDAAGNVFIGMDQVDAGESGVPPVLLALDPNGNRLWVDPGLAPGPIWNPIGLRSPMIGYSSTQTPEDAMVFFARSGMLQAFGPGDLCPTSNPLYGCSGHGECSCSTGTCRCEDACYYGDDCGTEQTCSGNGKCLDGGCICTDPCFAGEYCSIPVTCSGYGTCSSEDGGCQCDKCHSGADCEYLNDCTGRGTCDPDTGVCHCNPGAAGAECELTVHTKPPPGGLGAGWVFFIVLICVITVSTFGYSAFWKYRTGEWWIFKWRAADLFRRGGGGGERAPLATASVAHPANSAQADYSGL